MNSCNNRNTEPMLAGLERLGLSQYEAKCYLTLVGQGAANGYAVAKHAGIPTSKVYAALESLKVKGFVQSNNLDKPRYCPVDPDHVIERVRVQMEENLNMLSTNLRELFTVDTAFSAIALTNNQEILRHLRQLVTNTTGKLLMTAWPQELALVETDLHDLASLAKVFILCYGKYTIKGAKIFSHRRADLVMKENPGRMLLAVADGREALAAFYGAGNIAQGIWWRSTNIAAIIADHILHDVSLNQVIQALPDELQTNMEKKLVHLRRKLYFHE